MDIIDAIDDLAERSPLFTREKIDAILDVIPPEAQCCYTGQSVLAYCPDPTFTWDEVNAWTETTDVDIFVYSRAGLAALTQLFISQGWEPATEIDEFKASRIRFWDVNSKRFKLQTVGLKKDDMPLLNLSWYDGADDAVSVVKRFDQSYLCVGMDVRRRVFVDFRGSDHRVSHVNQMNGKFDVADVDVNFWIRQFDRVPKGWSRGIDTRPVARQYLEWVDEFIARGDWAAGSKTRHYADRRMAQVLEAVVAGGFTEKQAETMYHLFRQEDSTWEATRANLESVRKTIAEWLASVEDA